MTSVTRGRTAAIVALVVGVLSPLVEVHWARLRAARPLAAHDATAVAGSLPLVTPLARRSPGYDLPQSPVHCTNPSARRPSSSSAGRGDAAACTSGAVGC